MVGGGVLKETLKAPKASTMVSERRAPAAEAKSEEGLVEEKEPPRKDSNKEKKHLKSREKFGRALPPDRVMNPDQTRYYQHQQLMKKELKSRLRIRRGGFLGERTAEDTVAIGGGEAA